MALTYEVSKLECLARPCHLSPSVPAEAGHFGAAARAPICLIQGRAYTVSWLVETKVML